MSDQNNTIYTPYTLSGVKRAANRAADWRKQALNLFTLAGAVDAESLAESGAATLAESAGKAKDIRNMENEWRPMLARARATIDANALDDTDVATMEQAARDGIELRQASAPVAYKLLMQKLAGQVIKRVEGDLNTGKPGAREIIAEAERVWAERVAAAQAAEAAA